MFLEGYLLGLGMIVFIGPVFFLLLSISLQLGTRAGVSVALGIVISDVVCVYLCYYGVTSFLYLPNSVFWVGLIGGIILIILGLKYLLKPNSSLTFEVEISNLHYFNCFAKGFLVNFVNPFVFLVWIGVISYLKEKKVTEYYSHVYLSGVLSAILSTDLLKVFTARKIKSFLNQKALNYLFRICGFVLVCFGIRLIYLMN